MQSNNNLWLLLKLEFLLEIAEHKIRFKRELYIFEEGVLDIGLKVAIGLLDFFAHGVLQNYHPEGSGGSLSTRASVAVRPKLIDCSNPTAHMVHTGEVQHCCLDFSLAQRGFRCVVGSS